MPACWDVRTAKVREMLVCNVFRPPLEATTVVCLPNLGNCWPAIGELVENLILRAGLYGVYRPM